MSDEQPCCPHCNGPDFPPYKFGDRDIDIILKRQYPNARKCMDCGASFYNYEQQTRPPVNFATIAKEKAPMLVRAVDVDFEDAPEGRLVYSSLNKPKESA